MLTDFSYNLYRFLIISYSLDKLLKVKLSLCVKEVILLLMR